MGLCARDIMVTNVFSVTPCMSLVDMDNAFLQRSISGAPVVDNGKLRGVVSRADISRKLSETVQSAPATEAPRGSLMDLMTAASRNVKPAFERVRELCVGDIMVEKVVTVTPDTSVRTVGSLMVERKIHRVMVVENDALVGLISTLDLVKALLVDA
jgi:CBS domain-containing protein